MKKSSVRKVIVSLKRSLAPKHLSYLLKTKVLGLTYTFKRPELPKKIESLPVPEGTRITYVRDDKRNPLVCLAYRVHQSHDMYIVTIGYSMCDDEDQCEKRYGRNTAIERLLEMNKHCVRLVLPVEDVSTKETKHGPQPAREEIIEHLARKSGTHSKLSKKIATLLAARKRAEQLVEEKALLEEAKKIIAGALSL
jgi:hypothetical protein